MNEGFCQQKLCRKRDLKTFKAIGFYKKFRHSFNFGIVLVPAEGSQTVTAVDKAGNSTSVTVTVKPEETQGADVLGTGAPGTGDSSCIIPWAIMLLISGSALSFISTKRKRITR